jgi:hypothetical protein
VGSTGVSFGSRGVLVGNTAVSVGGIDVLVGGTAVSVSGIDVLVGGTDVSVGGTGVLTASVCVAGAEEHCVVTSRISVIVNVMSILRSFIQSIPLNLKSISTDRATYLFNSAI